MTVKYSHSRNNNTPKNIRQYFQKTNKHTDKGNKKRRYM